jgi:hypothetical protein
MRGKATPVIASSGIGGEHDPVAGGMPHAHTLERDVRRLGFAVEHDAVLGRAVGVHDQIAQRDVSGPLADRDHRTPVGREQDGPRGEAIAARVRALDRDLTVHDQPARGKPVASGRKRERAAVGDGLDLVLDDLLDAARRVGGGLGGVGLIILRARDGCAQGERQSERQEPRGGAHHYGRTTTRSMRR